MNKTQILVLTGVTILTSISCKRGNPYITLNELEEPVVTHNEEIDKFLVNPVDENVGSDGKHELSKPKPVHLSWNYSNSNAPKVYTVKIAEENDLLNPYVVTTTNNYFDFYNPKIKTTYYYRVECGNTKSNISSFIAKEDKLRMLNIDGVTNCRDLGGYKTEEGKEIKQGLIYRTARYNESNRDSYKKEITQKGEYTLKNQLGIKTEVDLRFDDREAGYAKDGHIEGIKYIPCRMDWRVGNILTDNKDKIKFLFDEVLSKPSSYPLSFHCNIGTDRTGCIAYTLLALCGVEERDLIGDYLLSNYGVIGGDRKFSSIEKTYPTTLRNGEVKASMATAAIALERECGVSIDTINKVREILIK